MNEELKKELDHINLFAEAFPNDSLKKIIFHLTKAIRMVDGDIEVKLKKLSKKAIIPKKAFPSDACFDLVAVSVKYDQETRNYIYGTGLAMEIPEGYVGRLFPRSSNRKTECYLTNSVGVIDCHYRGEVTVSYKDASDTSIPCEANAPYKVGDRIAQICFDKVIPTKLVEADELSETDRGEGGYGSTGE